MRSQPPASRILWISPCLALALALLSFLPVPLALAADQADLPTGGFVADGGPVNGATDQATDPALALQPNRVEPWVALAHENQIVVSQFMTATQSWVQQAGVLNRSLANPAGEPSLDFAGNNRDVPWVAWRETVDGLDLVNAALFNGSSWNLTPILNRDTTHAARQPTLTAGAIISGATPLPWVTWVENEGDVGQIVVSRAEPDNRVQGGFRWQAVGDVLNFDPGRAAVQPDLAFGGAGNTVPWVAWLEQGGDRPARIFASRFVDGSWQRIGRQANCGTNEIACALNLNAGLAAGVVRIATGHLPGESVPTPWLVFAENGTDGTALIRVMRLDRGVADNPSDDRFIPVGGAVNAECLAAIDRPGQRGSTPDLVFVGNVPHVSWIEELGGQAVLHVCHLADARSGLERWDLDTLVGANQAAGNAAAPSLATNSTTPYVAWQESGATTTVYVGHRAPTGPAWGANFPATLDGIDGAALTAAEVQAISPMLGAALAVQAANAEERFLRSNPVAVTTSAYHVNGAALIEEVQFALVADDEEAFLARYVVAENKIYVQDPDQPGVFLPPVTPGAGAPNIFTRFVTLEMPKVRIVTHGATSPTLDIEWSLIFEEGTFFTHYDQAVNIVYGGGQETGFYQVGTVFVGSQSTLPLVVNGTTAVAK